MSVLEVWLIVGGVILASVVAGTGVRSCSMGFVSLPEDIEPATIVAGTGVSVRSCSILAGGFGAVERRFWVVQVGSTSADGDCVVGEQNSEGFCSSEESSP